MNLKINTRSAANLNNHGRILFFAQQHSLNMINFLETNNKFDDEVDEKESSDYEIKFRQIIEKIDNEEFPMDEIGQLISDITSRPSICFLDEITALALKLNQIIPFTDAEQKSCIFRLLKLFMYNSENLTKCLIDSFILENICSILMDQNIFTKYKIPAIKCIHFIASRGNPLKIFDKISFIYKDKTIHTTPFDCLLELMKFHNPDTEIMKEINDKSGGIFTTDEDTIKLRLLILKFLVATLNYEKLPRSFAPEIVKHIIGRVIQNSNSVLSKELDPLKFLDCATYGCTLAVSNKITYSCFLSDLKEGAFNFFIDILRNNDENIKEGYLPSISINILLCIKTIVEETPEEAEKFYKYNIIEAMLNHIKNDDNTLVCLNAIETTASFLKADWPHFSESIIENQITQILYDHLEQSSLSIKIASLLALHTFITPLPINDAWDFMTNFPQIFERCCALIGADIDYDTLNLIFQAAYIMVNAYNAVGKNDELLQIIEENDISTMVDNYIDNGFELDYVILAKELKQLILGDYEHNE